MPATKPAKKTKSSAKAPASRTTKPTSPSRSAKSDLAPDRIAAILRALDEAYPNAVCALNHRTPWELLVATILSAQCTDVRVNMVTPELFKRFPTPPQWPRPRCRNLRHSSAPPASSTTRPNPSRARRKDSSSEFGGEVPQTLAELITIPGAARKTANVVLGVSFGKAEGVVVDTHVFRIARRLGLAKGDTPQKVEQELMRVIPQDRWIDFSHQVIHHGRQVCIARKPKCEQCVLEQLCHSKDKTWHS